MDTTTTSCNVGDKGINVNFHQKHSNTSNAKLSLNVNNVILNTIKAKVNMNSKKSAANVPTIHIIDENATTLPPKDGKLVMINYSRPIANVNNTVSSSNNHLKNGNLDDTFYNIDGQLLNIKNTCAFDTFTEIIKTMLIKM